MANTFSHLFYHLVFSTKHRENFIDKKIEQRVWAYIGGVARKHNLTAIQVGGIENHIHALIMSSPPIAPSRIAQWIKGDSSKWIHQEFRDLKRFAWQDGYGIFTVSRSSAPKVVNYIQDQRKHHSEKSFEEEFVELLELHEIEYDEKYLFG